MNERHAANTRPRNDAALTDIVCPFCALTCDDLSLSVDRGRPQAEGLRCPKARAGFSLAIAQTSARPQLRGSPCDWPAATERARQLLAQARLPLFDGLVGDLLDSRAAWRLAAHYRGVVDHRDGDAVARNLAVYQDSGWLVTSLGEARNRADLLVLLGGDLENALPRLGEKLFAPGHRLHRDAPGAILALRADPLRILNQTRILLGGGPLAEPDPAALELQQRLAASEYPVFVMGPFDDAPQDPAAELILRAATDLVRDINRERRAALLPLGSGLGDVTAQLSGGWHNGFGLRTSFARGYPEQDLRRHAGRRVLDDGGADLRVWLSSLSADAPARCGVPEIVIGHPAMQFGDSPPEVFLPVAVPGVHRNGFLHRGDGLRMLPLGAVTASDLPAIDALCRDLLPADAREPISC